MSLFDEIRVVIINFNLAPDTVDCVRSIANAGLDYSKIIIVDNNSSDDSVEYIKQAFPPELNILALDTNKGYTGGSNAGIQYAISAGAVWVFLMNNDTLVAPNFFSEFDKAVQKYGQKYTVFSPMILYFDPPNRIAYMGDKLIPGTMLTLNSWEGKDGRDEYPEIIPSDFVHGCGMLVHRSVYENIGAFDDSLFIYFEEVDFCWRLRLAGYEVAAFPSAKMWHKISAIMGKQKPRTRYLQTRNQIWVFRRYSKGVRLMLMFLYSLFRLLRNSLRDLMDGQPSNIKYSFRGWAEGWNTPQKAYVESGQWKS
ncbi:MAG: glycosyltransferase family 2 protein [Anaerolineaceae bacterium]|nr:glycosyltransferase family 2 protein [Anaerolineaceae bacterium]